MKGHVSGAVDRALTLGNDTISGGPKRKSWNGGGWAKGGSKTSRLRIEHHMVPVKTRKQRVNFGKRQQRKPRRLLSLLRVMEGVKVAHGCENYAQVS